jgi:hypothetical protein
MEMPREEFIRLVRDASRDKESDSYQQIYAFLLNCFTKADDDYDGKVGIYVPLRDGLKSSKSHKKLN